MIIWLTTGRVPCITHAITSDTGARARSRFINARALARGTAAKSHVFDPACFSMQRHEDTQKSACS